MMEKFPKTLFYHFSLLTGNTTFEPIIKTENDVINNLD